MGLGDIPKLPDEYIPRVEKLADSMQSGEVSFSAFFKDVMNAAGKDILPLVIAPVLEEMSDKMSQLLPLGVSVLTQMVGKELLIKVRDFGNFKVTFGFPPKVAKVTRLGPDEEPDPLMPNIEVDGIQVVPYLFRGHEGMLIMFMGQMIVINGLDVISEWMGGHMLDLANLSLGMVKGEILIPMQEPFVSAADAVLTRYGV